MYRGKYLAPKTRRPHGKKAALLLASMALLLVVGTVGTVAYLTDQTAPVPNTFDPGSVACQVVDTTDDLHHTGAVKNTGTVDAYVRVAIVVNWVDKDGNVYGKAPVSGKDYTLRFSDDKWLSVDGYYYFKAPLNHEMDEETSQIWVQNNSEAPEGYTLQLTILAQAIQADGVKADGIPAVQDAWKVVTVGSNRELVAVNSNP